MTTSQDTKYGRITIRDTRKPDQKTWTISTQNPNDHRTIVRKIEEHPHLEVTDHFFGYVLYKDVDSALGALCTIFDTSF